MRWRFNNFQNGGRPPSWIFKICSFCHVAFIGMSFCFLVQNFAKIGQSVHELWVKKRIARWRPPPSWIFKFQFLVTWLYSGWKFAIVHRISTKSDDFSLRYGDLTIPKWNGGRPPSWISKFAVFVMWLLSACRSASSYKISLKSDNRSMSYGYKSDFQDGGGRHLEF